MTRPAAVVGAPPQIEVEPFLARPDGSQFIYRLPNSLGVSAVPVQNRLMWDCVIVRFDATEPTHFDVADDLAPPRWFQRLLDALDDRRARRRRHDEVALQRSVRAHPAGKRRSR